jgi:PKD repeat protein
VTDTWSSVASYRWRFGDGTAASGRKTTHAYARVGTYTVTVTIKDSRGNVTVRKRLVRVVR